MVDNCSISIMRKLIAFSMLLFCFSALDAQTFTVNYGSYSMQYEVLSNTDKTVECQGLLSKATFVTNFIIPNRVPYSGNNYTVTRIGKMAFAQCRGLSGFLGIPVTVTHIEEHAFYECCNFTSALTIPASVENIEVGAFAGCTGFTALDVAKNNETYVAKDLMLLSKDLSCVIFCLPGAKGELELPTEVTTISESAFYGCEKLVGTLNLGANVNSIGANAFSYCSGFTKVNNCSPTPQVIEESVFYEVPIDTIPLYVLEASISTYQNAAVWGDFASVNVLVDNTSLGDVSIECPFVQKGAVLCFSEEVEVMVYNAAGVMLFAGVTNNYVLPTTGVYLLKIANQSYKVKY